MSATLFDDAAPLGGGAGVNGPNSSPDGTLARIKIAPACRHDAPDTSRAAADSVAGYTGNQRERVYAFVLSRGTTGATDAEVADGCDILIQSANPRRRELAKLGLIVRNGERRRTPSGRWADVWIAATHATKPAGASGDLGNAEGGEA
jgi:hypothetical protein